MHDERLPARSRRPAPGPVPGVRHPGIGPRRAHVPRSKLRWRGLVALALALTITIALDGVAASRQPDPEVSSARPADGVTAEIRERWQTARDRARQALAAEAAARELERRRRYQARLAELQARARAHERERQDRAAALLLAQTRATAERDAERRRRLEEARHRRREELRLRISTRRWYSEFRQTLGPALELTRRFAVELDRRERLPRIRPDDCIRYRDRVLDAAARGRRAPALDLQLRADRTLQALLAAGRTCSASSYFSFSDRVRRVLLEADRLDETVGGRIGTAATDGVSSVD